MEGSKSREERFFGAQQEADRVFAELIKYRIEKSCSYPVPMTPTSSRRTDSSERVSTSSTSN